MKHCWLLRLAAVVVVPAMLETAAWASSARQIPVAYEVDVVVAGGGCGAVAAAVAAVKSGATVFLAAPRNYLGEDIAGTMRLWLDPGETPATELARAVFSDSSAADAEGLKFTYKTDLPSSDRHKDTVDPSRLFWRHPLASAQYDSVQYDGDVTITADFGVSQAIKEAELVVFNRAGDYQAGRVLVQLSDDGRKWRDIGQVACENVGTATRVLLPMGATARYARVTVKRASGSKRLLLGAIRFIPAEAPAHTKRASAVRPLHVKTSLEEALSAAKVNYLLGCHATDLLVDGAGKPAGIVMANRAGRQAVIAKVVIDATERATIARQAGAQFGGFTPGKQTVKWITISDKAAQAGDVTVVRHEFPVAVFSSKGELPTNEKAFWFEHTLQLDLAEDSWPAFARLEQAVRERCYVPSQFYTADTPFMVPPCAIKGVKSASAMPPDLDALRPAGVERVWVLGGCADVPRPVAAKMLRPVALVELGAQVGKAAAGEAKRAARPEGVKVASVSATGARYAGNVKERLDGLRPVPPAPRVPEAARSLPVLGSYDVVVIGGGTAGAAAGIGAARQGAKTLVVEFLHGLGGVGTLGMIGKYWYGNRAGFTATVPENPTEVRMEFLRSELRKAGADIWFGSMGCGALVEGNRVTGAVVVTPHGRGVVLAKTVIDGTGNAEVAAAAGAETRFVEDHFALQASHIPPREVGAFYINGNLTAVDAADPLDVREAMLHRKEKYFDRGQIVDSRERQRIVGDYCLDWLDQINRRTFPDSIALAVSDYDSHGYQVHPYFMLKPARPPGDYARKFWSHVPYRCLLPRGVEGMLVIGLGLSAHRDAVPIVRMQPDLQNSGYAAGVACAMAAKAGVAPRQVNVKVLQQHLVEIGNLDRSVLNERDSFPMPKAEVAGAVQRVAANYDGLEVVLAQPEDSLPLLRAAYDAAGGVNKLAYAHVLGVMGDARGAETLIAEAQRRLEARDLAKPVGRKIAKNRTEMPMDDTARLLWALGGTGNRRAVPALCALAEATAGVEFATSARFRAIAVSLGRLGDPAAAPTLAVMMKSKAGKDEVSELIAACALFRCGDKDGAAWATLGRFVGGSNGPFSRLAWQVLNARHP